jgi:hypothetical protein
MRIMKKRALTFLGLALILAGALALAYGGISYTKGERLLNAGPFKASVNRQKRVAIPRWVGGAMLAGGVVSLIAGVRRRQI